MELFDSSHANAIAVREAQRAQEAAAAAAEAAAAVALEEENIWRLHQQALEHEESTWATAVVAEEEREGEERAVLDDTTRYAAMPLTDETVSERHGANQSWGQPISST